MRIASRLLAVILMLMVASSALIAFDIGHLLAGCIMLTIAVLPLSAARWQDDQVGHNNGVSATRTPADDWIWRFPPVA